MDWLKFWELLSISVESLTPECCHLRPNWLILRNESNKLTFPVYHSPNSSLVFSLIGLHEPSQELRLQPRCFLPRNSIPKATFTGKQDINRITVLKQNFALSFHLFFLEINFVKHEAKHKSSYFNFFLIISTRNFFSCFSLLELIVWMEWQKMLAISSISPLGFSWISLHTQWAGMNTLVTRKPKLLFNILTHFHCNHNTQDFNFRRLRHQTPAEVTQSWESC